MLNRALPFALGLGLLYSGHSTASHALLDAVDEQTVSAPKSTSLELIEIRAALRTHEKQIMSLKNQLDTALSTSRTKPPAKTAIASNVDIEAMKAFLAQHPALKEQMAAEESARADEYFKQAAENLTEQEALYSEISRLEFELKKQKHVNEAKVKKLTTEKEQVRESFLSEQKRHEESKERADRALSQAERKIACLYEEIKGLKKAETESTSKIGQLTSEIKKLHEALVLEQNASNSFREHVIELQEKLSTAEAKEVQSHEEISLLRKVAEILNEKLNIKTAELVQAAQKSEVATQKN